MADSADILKTILGDTEGFNALPEDTRQRLLKAAGLQNQSLLAKAERFVTGEGQKEFEYPDFDPSNLDPNLKRMGAGLPDPRYRSPIPEAPIAYNATVHNDARMDVLKNYRPDLAETVKQDKFGNPYVTMDGKQFYLNRPGASMQDAREAGATALAALPLFARGRGTYKGDPAPPPSNFIQKGMTSPSVIRRGATATGAGAAASATQDATAQLGGSKEGISGERAAVSGLLGGATMFAWPIIRAIGVKPFQAIFSKPNVIRGEFTTEAAEIMRKAGVDPDSFTAAEKVEVDRLLREATDPGALAAAEQALRLDPQVRLTKGQASGDLGQQVTEYQARGGFMGDAAKEKMQAFDDEARSALAQNIQGMRKRLVGGEAPFDVHNVGVERAQLQLGQERIAAKQKYGQLYKDVDTFSDDALAWVETPERFRQKLLNTPDVVENLDQMPALKKIVDDFETKVMGLETGPGGAGGTAGSKTPQVNELFAWRKRLQAKINGATPDEQRILIGVKREFDNFMKDTVADGLVRGDPRLISLWQDAIKSRADYGRMFEADDIIDRITTLTKSGTELAIDPHAAGNLIFGASDLGFVSKWNIVKNVRTLKSRLTPESWNALRGDFMIRMLGMTREQLEAVSSGSAKLPSGQKFKSSLETFKTRNKGLYDTLFDEEESKLMSKVADVWHRVTVPKPGANNPSGSGAWVLKAGQRVANGYVGTALKELSSFLAPTARWIIKPIKGSVKASEATGHGEGYYPPTKTLAPPAPPVSTLGGRGGERALDRYERYEDTP